ncbi:MAG: TPM domain-containing protein [Cyanobacteria bacterium P01_D01_bin.36]
MSVTSTFQMSRRRQRFFILAVSIGISFALALLPLRPSIAVFVEDVPNPQTVSNTWVMDSANMLSERTEAELNQMIAELEATNGSEIAVVTVLDTQGSASPKAFATELFNEWGIGKEGVDNGVLFLISKGDRRNEIETGYGVEGILTDARLGSILAKKVTPQFKDGNFDAGVLAGTEAMISLLNGEAFSPLVRVRDYTSRFFDTLVTAFLSVPFWVGIATTGATAAFLKWLSKEHTKPVSILPTGRESLQPAGTFLGPFLAWVLRGLIGPEVSREKGLSIATPKYNGVVGYVFNLTTLRGTTGPETARLVGYRLSNNVVKSGWKLFCLGFGIVLVIAIVFPAQKWFVPLFAWLWLAYELWLNYSGENIFDRALASPEALEKSSSALVLSRNLRPPVAERLNQTVRQWSAISGVIVLILFGSSILFVRLGLLLLPYTSTALLFACAGIFRLVRSLPNNPQITCQTCNGPMEQLNRAQIQQHLTKAEKLEIKLFTKQYEGWCCPTCSAQIAPDSLSIHLFYQEHYQHGYETCLVCKTKALKVTTETIKPATTKTTGIRKTTRHCHACDAHSEKETKIQRRRPPTRSSSSGISSDSYSGSSYSSSAGSSYSGGSDSGGSFGGGSSGGGGAGSDW